ncbi:MAG: hypothetical protein JWL57_1589 [Actinobacteria bacterium]|nr:hypothetical protein [Actinomycetota bacterium]
MSPLKIAWAAALTAAAVALGSCSSSSNDNPTIGGGAVGQISDVTMQAANGGQSGAAKLTESPSVVLSVTISLQNAPGPQQPASIHAGTCNGFAPDPKFALNAVVKGQSTTSPVNSTLGELSSSPYVIVVQRSTTDPTTASCGVIPTAATSPASP